MESISWSRYFTILLVATFIYYLFIWIVIFKASIPAMIRIGAIDSPHGLGEDGPDEVITTAQHVMDELPPLFKHGANKNELVFSLQ